MNGFFLKIYVEIDLDPGRNSITNRPVYYKIKQKTTTYLFFPFELQKKCRVFKDFLHLKRFTLQHNKTPPTKLKIPVFWIRV